MTARKSDTQARWGGYWPLARARALVPALNDLIDATQHVQETSGWTDEQILTYVKSCLNVNRGDKAS